MKLGFVIRLKLLFKARNYKLLSQYVGVCQMQSLWTRRAGPETSVGTELRCPLYQRPVNLTGLRNLWGRAIWAGTPRVNINSGCCLYNL